MEIDRPVRRGDWKREAVKRGLGKKAGNANAASRTRRADPCKTRLIEAARCVTGIQQHAQRAGSGGPLRHESS
jgi:hypothetical protein